jgi:hypothetical protein
VVTHVVAARSRAAVAIVDGSLAACLSECACNCADSTDGTVEALHPAMA